MKKKENLDLKFSDKESDSKHSENEGKVQCDTCQRDLNGETNGGIVGNGDVNKECETNLDPAAVPLLKSASKSIYIVLYSYTVT